MTWSAVVLAQHGHDVVPAGDGWVTAVRVPVLGALVVLVGAVLLRFVTPAGRAVRVVASGGAVVVVAGEALLASSSPRPVDVVAAVAVPLALAVAALVAAPFRVRAGWVFAAAAAVLALAHLSRVPGADAGERVALLQAALLTAVAALAWVVAAPLDVPAAHAPAVALALAVLAGTTQLTALEPGRPVTGVPQVRDAHGGRVLVAPQRPGWNLVQVAEPGTEVGTDPAVLTPATPRPGAGGAWALVELPEGRSTLWVRRGGEPVAVPVDTGAAAGPDLTSADGPECAAAAVGALLSGKVRALRDCPADHLDPADAAALRAVVGFVAGRGHRSVTLVEDGSARSVAAAAVVREAARRHGAEVTGWRPGERGSAGPGSAPGPAPVLFVAGWAAADQALRAVASGALPGEGSYLAPWLLTAPLLRIPAGQLVPLRTHPQEPDRLAHVAALAAGAPDTTASPAGYTAWRGTPEPAPARLYAASLVTMQLSTTGHAHGGATWFPGGAVTPVSGPLPGT